jgi:signal transduction histidine kinase
MASGETGLKGLASRSLGPFTLLEWAPTVLLLPVALWESVGGQAEVLLGPPAAVGGCVGAATVALLWRWRHPLWVLCITSVAVLLPSFAWGSSHLTAGVLAMCVAVFAAGAHGSRPWSALAMPVGIATTLVFLANDPADSVGASWTWSLNLLWIYGVGAWVRQNHRLVEQSGAEASALAAAAAAEDRVRIARDLHDVLAHSLAVMLVQAEAVDELLEDDPAKARKALGNVRDTGRAALADIRRIVGTLRGAEPPAGQDVLNGAPGLHSVPALVDAIRGAGLPVELVVGGDLDAVAAAEGGVAYRVVQEALTNTLRHAGPVSTQVSLLVSDGWLRVCVHDRGAVDGRTVGTVPRQSTGGHGLVGMRERIEQAGGGFEAFPDPGGGFTVTATLPATRASAEPG